jgi:hypothetical protein
MRLETRVTILKKLPPKHYYWEEEIKVGLPHITVQSIEVTLSETCKLMVSMQRPIDFHKFDRSAERIVRELNKYVRSINIIRPPDYMAWSSYSYDIVEETFVLWIGSSDLDNVKFSGEQRKIVKRALDGKIKDLYTRNPSKEKSQMVYRARGYRGKCK